MNHSNFTKQRLAYLNRRKKGSAIILVLIIGISLIIVLLSQLDRGVTSRKLNLTNNLYHEARNAAESWTEYGCADVVRRFESLSAFPDDELQKNAIEVPDSATSFYANSNIDLNLTEVKGGQIGDIYELYIDPSDPRWEFDPMKGKRVFVRDINIFAKATASSDKIGHPSTAYVQQTLQMRDSPLFSNAIFYNIDLELHPGAVMNIYGPVHTNKDCWVQTSKSLYFHDVVSASGRFLHGNPKDPDKPHWQYNGVYFQNADGDFKNMYLEGDTKTDEAWLDHKQPNWREDSSQMWDGNVQDSAHNVPTYNAAGIADYVPDDPWTAENELENHAYAIIEPLLPAGHSDRKTDSVRNQKLHAKAGLVLKVELDSSTDTGLRIRAYKWARVNTSIPVNPQNPFDGNLALDANGDPYLIEVQLPCQDLVSALSSDLIGTEKSDLSGVDNPTSTAEPALYKIVSGSVVTGLFDRRQGLEISPVSLDVGILRKIVDDQANATGTNLGETYWEDSSGTVTYNPVTDWNGVVYVDFPVESSAGSSIAKIVKMDPDLTISKTTYEEREVGTGQFQTVTTNKWEDVGWGNGRYDYWRNPRYYYKRNGTLVKWGNYDWVERTEQVEITQTQTVPVTTTSTVHLALQILNGEYIPSPTYIRDRGLTIATNAPIYLVGDYNADGVVHTNDAQLIEHTHYKDTNGNYYDEPPAAFICDSFTVLSNRWASSNRKHSEESNDDNRVAYQFTEVSAAILTGLKPTSPIGSPAQASGGQSGGAHNFPRFLENWTTTLTLRTSMVALYESEVHTAPMPYGPTYYDPPDRDWGFNENFENGYYPPGTPNVRTFRRTTFKDITKEEYVTGTQF